jgi:nicotinamidase-related amidase
MESNNSHTALLVMDMQSTILKMAPDPAGIAAKVTKAIAHARSKKMPVIYVVVGFRPGMPEISMNNKSFKAVGERMAGVDMNDWMKIDASVAPQASDIIVTKRRVSAFAGSDLEVVLRAQGIKRMVLAGISTSGVVLSTTREAADKDYGITILSDGCADPDAEVHTVLTTKVFPRQADVMTIDEWCKS